MRRAAGLLLVLACGVGAVRSGDPIYYRRGEDGVIVLTNVPDRKDLRALRSHGWKGGRRSGEEFREMIARTALQHGLHPELVYAVAAVESNFNPDAVSVKGAQGLMQLMPGTAQRFGVIDPYDPAENVLGGVRYLRYLLDRFNGDSRLALAAYNAGENAVLAVRGIPPFRETRNYVAKVLRRFGPSRTPYVTPPGESAPPKGDTSGRTR
jgi:soluble lytic murein transglycosylase-like protein